MGWGGSYLGSGYEWNNEVHDVGCFWKGLTASWNDNIGKDTVIGTAVVNLSDLAAFKGVWETTLQVKTAKNKSQGELYVKLTLLIQLFKE